MWSPRLLVLVSTVGIAASSGGCIFQTGPGGSPSSAATSGAGGSGGAASSTGSEHTTTSTGLAVTTDEACTSFAEALCARRDVCSNGHLTMREYGDVETCVERQRAQCLLRAGAPDSAGTADRTAACASELAGVSCSDLFSATLPADCAPLPGPKTGGSACAFNAECASAYCAISQNAACGVCSAAPTAGAGCTTDVGCGADRGLRCDPATLTCVELRDAGQACGDTTQCRSDLSCVGATATSVGSCQTAVSTVGAPCDSTRSTAPDCDPTLGLHCMNGACAAVNYSYDGGSCGVTSSGDTECALNGMCLGNPGSKACVGSVLDGNACDTLNGPSCELPAHCVVTVGASGGTCQLPDASRCR